MRYNIAASDFTLRARHALLKPLSAVYGGKGLLAENYIT